MSAVYTMPMSLILGHGHTGSEYNADTRPKLLADGADNRSALDRMDDIKPDRRESRVDRREFNADDAMAASGDCFITLATRLDRLAQGLPADSAAQIEIEHMVRSLFYLQDHYAVVAKHKLGRMQG